MALTGPQARICDDDCTKNDVDVLTVVVPEGSTTYALTFMARLPGKSQSLVTITRNDDYDSSVTSSLG